MRSHLSSYACFFAFSASSMLAGSFWSIGGFCDGKMDSMNCSTWKDVSDLLYNGMMHLTLPSVMEIFKKLGSCGLFFFAIF